jgi:hypothetical protein
MVKVDGKNREGDILQRTAPAVLYRGILSTLSGG